MWPRYVGAKHGLVWVRPEPTGVQHVQDVLDVLEMLLHGGAVDDQVINEGDSAVKYRGWA
jgi:hypothetical protein